MIRPDTVAPRTPTETLQQILARDDAPISASTLLRELSEPASRLFQAVQRYTDGLRVAAEQLLGPQTVAALDRADQLVPWLTSEPAWPTLRAHLLGLATETGEHPLLQLQIAASGRDLRTAGDMAAVLDWCLPELASAGPGPLPWLPGIPGEAPRASRLGWLFDKAVPTSGRPRPTTSRPRLPGGRPSGLGPAGKLPKHRPHWRSRDMADCQRHRSTGPTTSLRRPSRDSPYSLWQQRLDRAVARLNDPQVNAQRQGRRAGRTTHDRKYDDSQRPHRTSGRRPSGPSAPGR